MANDVNIFDKYGIKEVANVYFEALADDPAAGIYKDDIVLYLDTLKVSTIETSAEQTDARGGWGNPKLITWDYGKEITITLTDALMSLESLRFMMGGAIKKGDSKHEVLVRHTAEFKLDSNGLVPEIIDSSTKTKYTSAAPLAGYPVRAINLTTGVRTQFTSNAIETGKKLKFKNDAAGVDGTTAAAAGDRIRIFWVEQVNGSNDKDNAVEVTISPDTFPGTYRVVGDTFIRNQVTGADEAFQFIINQAKVGSSVTLTLEAEGDPSTFEMTLTVLRSATDANEMMKLIRYNPVTTTSSGGASNDDIGSIAASGSE